MIIVIRLLYFDFRSNVDKSLISIRDGAHDDQLCTQNCKENGQIFNHTPYQCTFQSNKISNLIQYEKIEVDTLPKQEWPTGDEKAMKVADFDFKSDLAKERERELELGLRADEDVKELVTSLEQM